MTMTFYHPHQKELIEAIKEADVIADYIATMTDGYAIAAIRCVF